MNAEEMEWLPVFEEIALDPFFRPKFTLAILQAIDSEFDPKQPKLNIDPAEDCDAISEAPLQGLPSRTMISIKWDKEKLPLTSPEIGKLVEACKRTKSAALLLILPLALPDSISEHLSSRDRRVPHVRLKIIGYQEVLGLVKHHPAIVTRHVPHLIPLAVKERLRTAETNSQDEWKHKQLARLDKLRDAYAQDNLSLFLGAGVSIQAGLPTWRELIDHLMIRVVQNLRTVPAPLTPTKVQSAAKTLSAFRGDNPLISARYIRKALRDDFIPTLRAALYQGFDSTKPKKLMRELAELCRPTRTRKGARAVVTYNFDDLFERELDRLNISRHTISSDVDHSRTDTLSIFHVHGLLRGDMTKDSSTSLIDLAFSEERYHHLYTQAYSWSNLQQLFLLKNSTCLFIGFSMTDPNLRRLLEISAAKGQPPQHYAFLKRTLPQDALSTFEKPSELSHNEISMILKAHHEIQELGFEELGVNVIWVQDFNEIEGCLRKIRSSNTSSQLAS